MVEILGLAQRQVEEQTQGDRGLDGHIQVHGLSATPFNMYHLIC